MKKKQRKYVCVEIVVYRTVKGLIVRNVKILRMKKYMRYFIATALGNAGWKGEGMERLTHKRSNGIKSGYWSPAKKEELVQRLAAYENTGVTPEELKIIEEEYSKMAKELSMLRQ